MHKFVKFYISLAHNRRRTIEESKATVALNCVKDPSLDL